MDEREFYQTPTEEEVKQRSIEFLTKVKEMVDKTTFDQYAYTMMSCYYGSLSYDDFKTRVAFVLRDWDVLVKEFYHLPWGLSNSSCESSKINEKEKDCNDVKKPDMERMIGLLNKIEALGKETHGKFLEAVMFSGDISTVIERLAVVLPGHVILREEFTTLMIDSGLLKP